MKKPHKVMHPRTSFLLIGQGSNTNNPPKATDQLLLLAAALAVRTNTIAAVLYQVPNQPCGFSDDEWHPRSEDDIIAYTWAHFIRNPEEVEWPLHIPMTKAAVRAMDTLQTYACKHLKIQIESFVVAGASKRGWTTWLTAAVDKVTFKLPLPCLV
jgi:PhoPQ-activated pathogenicity-related protein